MTQHDEEIQRLQHELETANSRLVELERENVSLLNDVPSEDFLRQIRAQAVDEARKVVVTSTCATFGEYACGFTDCDDQWEDALVDIVAKIKEGAL